jgi:release factor glutamine methyltransferase
VTSAQRPGATDHFAGQTIETVRRALAKRLLAAGIETAELDTRMLVGAALDLDLTGLIAQAARRIAACRASRSRAFSAARNFGDCR